MTGESDTARLPRFAHAAITQHRLAEGIYTWPDSWWGAILEDL